MGLIPALLVILMKKLSLLTLAFIIMVAYSGCESTGANSTKDDDEDEYVYVTSTNSRIPRKVKKGSSYNQDAGSSPMGSVSGQEARDYIGTAGATRSQGND